MLRRHNTNVEDGKWVLRSRECQLIIPFAATPLPRDQVAARHQYWQSKLHQIGKWRNGASGNKVVARPTSMSKCLCACCLYAQSCAEARRIRNSLEKVRLLLCCLDQLKRCVAVRSEEACSEWHAGKATTRPKVGDLRTMCREERFDERHCNKGVEQVAHRTIARCSNARKVNRRIPRVEESQVGSNYRALALIEWCEPCGGKQRRKCFERFNLCWCKCRRVSWQRQPLVRSQSLAPGFVTVLRAGRPIERRTTSRTSST